MERCKLSDSFFNLILTEVVRANCLQIYLAFGLGQRGLLYTSPASRSAGVDLFVRGTCLPVVLYFTAGGVAVVNWY